MTGPWRDRNGKAAGIVVTQDEIDMPGYRELVKAKINAGIESSKDGRSRSLEEVAARVKESIRNTPRGR